MYTGGDTYTRRGCSMRLSGGGSTGAAGCGFGCGAGSGSRGLQLHDASQRQSTVLSPSPVFSRPVPPHVHPGAQLPGVGVGVGVGAGPGGGAGDRTHAAP